MANEPLQVLVKSVFEATGVNAAIGSINSMDRQISQVSRGMSKFMGLFAAGGAISGIVAFGVSAVKSYAESEKAVAQLTQAMKNLGSYSASALQDQLDFATQMQRTTKYTDEQVMAVQAALTTYGLYGEQLKAATRATLDMATQTGSAEAAAKLVGKAYQGQTDSLSKMGIKISETTVGSEKFAAVLREVQRRFGGLAEAEGKTFAGQLEIVKNGFDDLKESLGSKLMPVANETLEWFRDLDTVLGYIMEKFQKSPRTLADVDKEIKQLQKAFKDSGNNNGMIYTGPFQRTSIEEASARMRALVAEQKALRAAAAPGPGGPSPAGPAVDPAEARKAAAILEQVDDFYLSQRGQLYERFFGKANLAARRSYVAQAKSAEDMKDRQKNVLRDLEQEYAAAAHTFSGGFKQALLETETSLWDFSASFNSAINAAVGPTQQALKDFFNMSSEGFGNIGRLAEKTFKSIMNAFYDMITQMIAKYLVFQMVTGMDLGGTAFGKFLGFASGGPIPGPKGAPMPIMAHGGEFMLSANVVDAIKAGRPTSNLAAVSGGAAGGSGASISYSPTININGGVSGGNVKEICRQIADAGRKGVTEALDAAKVMYKQGAKRSGETAL